MSLTTLFPSIGSMLGGTLPGVSPLSLPKTGDHTGAGLVPVKPWEVPSTFTAEVALRASHDARSEDLATPNDPKIPVGSP